MNRNTHLGALNQWLLTEEEKIKQLAEIEIIRTKIAKNTQAVQRNMN